MNSYLSCCCLLALAIAGKANPRPPNFLPIVTLGRISHPIYRFKYVVNDPVTGDNKGQWEHRNGDAVKGSYYLVEPDGSLRIVDYTADDATGFNAVVRRIGANLHPKKPVWNPLLTSGPSIKPGAPTRHNGPNTKPRATPILPFNTPLFNPLYAPTLKPMAAPLIPADPIGFGKPIVVAEPLVPSLPILPKPLESEPQDTPLELIPLISHYKWAPFVTISGTTYGRKGIQRRWTSGPFSLDGKSLIIRRKH